MPVNVLIVDDSAVIRQFLTQELRREPDINIVGTAVDPYKARDMIVELQPDVITLDIEMPKMDGLTFLKKLMRYYPIPVIIISALTTSGSEIAMATLQSGAVDVVAKPTTMKPAGEWTIQLIEKVLAAADVDPTKCAVPESAKAKPVATIARQQFANKIITIGASTGGTVALEQILTVLPDNTPPIVIVQHMPEHFTRYFADRLNGLCRISVKEAENGDQLLPGRALIAPGNYHMLVKKIAGSYFAEVRDGPLVCRQRPAVDVMFRSVARSVGRIAVGVILTGMGNDGAAGMLELKQAGAYTIAQDEASSIVFGMPKEAIKLGGVDKIVSLSGIPGAILTAVKSHEER
ncbi:MAG: chemotaxis response regulator protein-glutamate methylesterase [bacterium]|nr:chemotaxis response regulator protein-glutamate methylesterase [bacterium]